MMIREAFACCCILSLAAQVVAADTIVPVTYGSAVKLVSGSSGAEKFLLRSLDVQWNGRARDGNIVTSISDETNPGVYWVIEPIAEGIASGDIVKCGDKIVLRHGVSSKF